MKRFPSYVEKCLGSKACNENKDKVKALYILHGIEHLHILMITQYFLYLQI